MCVDDPDFFKRGSKVESTKRFLCFPLHKMNTIIVSLCVLFLHYHAHRRFMKWIVKQSQVTVFYSCFNIEEDQEKFCWKPKGKSTQHHYHTHATSWPDEYAWTYLSLISKDKQGLATSVRISTLYIPPNQLAFSISIWGWKRVVFLFCCHWLMVISFTPLQKVEKNQSQRGVKYQVEIDDFQIWAGSEGMLFLHVWKCEVIRMEWSKTQLN